MARLRVVRYNKRVTVFRCRACGSALTGDLVRTDALPATVDHDERDPVTRRAPSTVARACGAPVATLAADCYGPHELHLHAKAVRAVD